jgi:hypothetical protein
MLPGIILQNESSLIIARLIFPAAITTVFPGRRRPGSFHNLPSYIVKGFGRYIIVILTNTIVTKLNLFLQKIQIVNHLTKKSKRMRSHFLLPGDPYPGFFYGEECI